MKRAPKSVRVLAIDVGGSGVKLLATGEVTPRRFASGKEMTPADLVTKTLKLAKGWSYDVVSIGIPAVVGAQGPREEPGNLGPGWVGFDFSAAFAKPVKIINDAAMQGLGSYTGGSMLFLGLGTGVGSALIADNVIVPLELGELPYGKKSTLRDYLAKSAIRRIGKKRWRREVARVAEGLLKAFRADYVVLGGGNARELKEELPAGVRIGHNRSAFRGGYRLWGLDTVPLHSAEELPAGRSEATEWRLV